MNSAYQKLLERSKETALVHGAASLLGWDQETFMPKKGLDFRAGQLAWLDGRAHRLWTDPEVGRWIDRCRTTTTPGDNAEAANLREWDRSFRRATRIPAELVEEFSRVKCLAREAWIEARRRSDFQVFAPFLSQVIGICRRMADYWGFEDSPYDALLEEFEPGARTSRLAPLFTELGSVVASLVRSLPDRRPVDLKGDYPVAAQQALNRRVAEAIGFDFEGGRIDTAPHPFCSGLGPGDCRLTTRYNERDFTQSLFGVLHEAGHGMYEQGLPAGDFGTPLGSAVSLGIHESQSRLWENHVGRSLEFWQRWLPVAAEYFPRLKTLEPAQVCQAVNQTAPSFIRVEAGELTYDLHVVLRFEIEREVIEGALAVEDLPARWNERFKSLLGLEVPDDARGCLQDIHWSLGSFGYFPTYTLGNLNASQLFHRAEQEIPGLRALLGRGEYAPLLEWLRKKVHVHGRRYLADDLMIHATGQPTSPGFHEDYLRAKFK